MAPLTPQVPGLGTGNSSPHPAPTPPSSRAEEPLPAIVARSPSPSSDEMTFRISKRFFGETLLPLLSEKRSRYYQTIQNLYNEIRTLEARKNEEENQLSCLHKGKEEIEKKIITSSRIIEAAESNIQYYVRQHEEEVDSLREFDRSLAEHPALKAVFQLSREPSPFSPPQGKRQADASEGTSPAKRSRVERSSISQVDRTFLAKVYSKENLSAYAERGEFYWESKKVKIVEFKNAEEILVDSMDGKEPQAVSHDQMVFIPKKETTVFVKIITTQSFEAVLVQKTALRSEPIESHRQSRLTIMGTKVGSGNEKLQRRVRVLGEVLPFGPGDSQAQLLREDVKSRGEYHISLIHNPL